MQQESSTPSSPPPPLPVRKNHFWLAHGRIDGFGFLSRISLLVVALILFSYFLKNVFLIFLIILFVCIYFLMITIIKRLHDFNFSGWWSALYCILNGLSSPVFISHYNFPPIIQTICNLVNFFLFIILIFMPGSIGTNRFGETYQSNIAEKIIAIIFGILLTIGLIYGFL